MKILPLRPPSNNSFRHSSPPPSHGESSSIHDPFQISIKTALFTALLTCGNMFLPPMMINPDYAAISSSSSYPRPVLDQVDRVVDGDTLILQTTGRVRMIGMNTPETVAPAQRQGAPPQCFGPEASAYTKTMLPSGTKVKLELDKEPVDKYGRNLAYVFKEKDGTFINAELVKGGYARAKTYGQNDRYESLFKDYESDAKTNKRGLWGQCQVVKTEVETKLKATPLTDTKKGNGGGTAASIPNPGDSKNCADFGTYEEAKEWYDKYFPLYGDVARLDGNNDGIPCESLRGKKSN